MDINKICPGCMQEIENRESVRSCPNCGYDLKNVSAELHQLQPMTILAGKYLVGKVIGEGGFGISYLGIDLNLEIVVAIKEFYPNGFVTRESNHSTRISLYSGKNEADVSKWREGFINEAKNLAKFSNLNGIVAVKDFFDENNTAYIVMEYIDGITLKQYLRQNGGKIPADKTFEMMEPVIRSLSKVHDSGMIHRDISPDNIMITKYGGMKLLDFGAAREFVGSVEKSLSIMLKPGYAPEEQYRSHGKQGPWSDVYALTATIYKCITGITPVESMERMREDTLKSPKALGIKLSDGQDAAIRQGMAVYAENRIQSMDDLYSALYSVSADTTPKMQQSAFSDRAEVSSRSVKNVGAGHTDIVISDAQKKIILIGAAVVCGVLLIAVCILLMPKRTVREDRENTISPVANVDKDMDGQMQRGEALYEEEIPQKKQDPNDDKADDISAQVNEIAASVSDYDNLEEVRSALDRYLDLAQEYGNKDNLGKQVFQLFDIYQNAMLQQINNCNSQEPNAMLYMQITEDIGTALGYAERFEECGIGVNSEELEEVDREVQSSYKSRMISNFDSYAQNEILNNGVVSRSELWAKMEGINNTDLYDSSNPEDPLRLRYEAALTLYTDSELDKLDNVGEKIGKVYEVLLDTEYSPLLIYYLSEQYGDPNAYEWYGTYCNLDYDLGYLSVADQKNFVYYYYTDPDYREIRKAFREYMSNEL